MMTTDLTAIEKHQTRLRKMTQRIVIEHGYLENLAETTPEENAVMHYLNCALNTLHEMNAE